MPPSRQGLHCDLDFHHSHPAPPRLLPGSPKVLFKVFSTSRFSHVLPLLVWNTLYINPTNPSVVKLYSSSRFQLYMSLSQSLLGSKPGVGVLLHTCTGHNVSQITDCTFPEGRTDFSTLHLYLYSIGFLNLSTMDITDKVLL